MIGYRVKASTHAFADGEQSVIPVLASVTPVIDTYPFYIPADSTQFSMDIPQLPDSSCVTLQYCDNPVWYIVTALPGLVETNYKNASAAAAALFSASVAEGLLKDHPQIAAGLRQWNESDGSDSTLVSMLQRNSDLKTLLLQATPWMSDAQSDTERMQRLALLLDSRQIVQAKAHAIKVLGDLHIAGEGWMWIPEYPETSTWATYQTLEVLGRLNGIGYLPADKNLATMINESLKWYERYTQRLYKKYPRDTYSEYVTLCAAWPSFRQSATGSRITSRYVQRLVKGWKKLSLTSKPMAAKLLKQYGYPRVARQVMESVLEFAVTTPEGGMCWPSINERAGDTMGQLAFTAQTMTILADITGTSSRNAVDAIAQWLLLQKEARNWGTSFVATEVIASLLKITSGWLTDASPVKIAIGADTLSSSPAEKLLGYVKCDISQYSPSGNALTIDSCGNHPSWGAVYAQSIQPMLEVSAAGCDEINIRKALYVRRDTDLVPIDEIKVGDRATVQLTLKVTRDMEYVAIVDDRCAGFEPVDQMPGAIWSEGLCFYRESLDSSTRIFIRHLPAGTYVLTYDVWANNAGTFTSGIASVQSQYAPALSAHSAGTLVTISN